MVRLTMCQWDIVTILALARDSQYLFNGHRFRHAPLHVSLIHLDFELFWLIERQNQNHLKHCCSTSFPWSNLQQESTLPRFDQKKKQQADCIARTRENLMTDVFLFVAESHLRRPICWSTSHKSECARPFAVNSTNFRQKLTIGFRY